MSGDLSVNYSSMKRNLTMRGHVHPRGLDLIENRILFVFGTPLLTYIKDAIAKGASRIVIAKETGIDPKTLQKFADQHQLEFPKSVRQCDFTNINKAIRARQHLRDDLILLTWRGTTKCLAKWAQYLNIGESTLRKRHRLGWPVDRILNEPISRTGGYGRVTWSYRCRLCGALNRLAIRYHRHMSYDYGKQSTKCWNAANHYRPSHMEFHSVHGSGG